MKVLYVATDQTVPGSTGGSVHVEEVACGLAERGHEVHVVAHGDPSTVDAFQLHPSRPLFEHLMFRWTAQRQIERLIDHLRAEVVLERYYNFAGEGIRAAFHRGIPAVLEVNSPVIDHPGSMKAWLDRLLVFRPMKRLREEQCRKSSAIVTPLPSILPGTVPPEKVHPIHWGANVETFQPGLTPQGAAAEAPIPPDARVVVFSGSFRPWHGADVLVRAAAMVLEKEEGSTAYFMFLGTGPSHARVVEEIERAGIGPRCHVAGAVPYHLMPYYLARCHIGVAPYQPSRHDQMQLGFYWSPLKIFEYMATGLPVVALDVDPLREIVREGREGRLVEERNEQGWAEAITDLVASPELCDEMGRSARDRVVSGYSWQVHCEKLERVLEAVTRG